MSQPTESGGATNGRSDYDIASIFRLYGAEAQAQYSFSDAQRRVMRSIIACRTAELGGHLDACDQCGVIRPSYNSCRDRHCPKCQTPRQAQWVALRAARMLPLPHFHVVFTVPGRLRALFRSHPVELFEMLFSSVSKTLLKFGEDPEWVGGQLGITAVLHTWTRDLDFHPHLHCIVTAGGLSADGQAWLSPKHGQKFLFPVHALGEVFRAKFLDELERFAYQNPNALGRVDEIDALFHRMRSKSWNVHVERPLSNAEHVVNYLGLYTHRVAISNHRIVDFDGGFVEFKTHDPKTTRLPAVEFIRRFLQHVLPDGFVKIRHYGLYSSSHANGRLEAARALLPVSPTSRSPTVVKTESGKLKAVDVVTLLKLLTGRDPRTCPDCKCGIMNPIEALPPVRGPPA